MNLRVSAKDLIQNHLTMALFNHAAVWEEEPELWPKGYYCNGHVLVDAEKMSKSKGNFLMMNDTIQTYGADATRFACADAGDSLDDANFSRETADAAILSLITEDAWISETLTSVDLRSGEENLIDKILLNETNRLIASAGSNFARMQFKEGLKEGWFEMLNARNDYRAWCKDSGVPMHKGAVLRWAETIVILICPICPHWYVFENENYDRFIEFASSYSPSVGVSTGPRGYGNRSETSGWPFGHHGRWRRKKTKF
jgi:leucyl-tRNA synthetase